MHLWGYVILPLSGSLQDATFAACAEVQYKISVPNNQTQSSLVYYRLHL
jgi:hypothetical protein